MGDWIKNNKFEAGLLLVVVLIAGGAYFLAGNSGTAYEEASNRYASAAGQINQAMSLRPAPTDSNEQEFRKQVLDYRGEVEGLQKALLAYRPADLKQISPADFQTNLNQSYEKLKETFTVKGIEFPEDKWRLGFEEYMGEPPRDEATAQLNYQLTALSWLYEELAKANPSALLNVHRPKLTVESAAAAPANTGRRNRRTRPSQEAAKEPYEALPVEISFRASEPSVRKFINALVNSKDHFFVIRNMRIQNELFDKPPRRDAVEFDEDAGGGDNPFPGFDFPPPEEEIPAEEPEGGAPAEEAPAEEAAPDFPAAGGGDDGDKGDRILGQVLGAEELNVFLQLDLLLFDDGAKLPEVQK